MDKEAEEQNYDNYINQKTKIGIDHDKKQNLIEKKEEARECLKEQKHTILLVRQQLREFFYLIYLQGIQDGR